MPQEKQTKTNTRKILLVIIFILMIGFGFGRGEKVKADDTINCSSINQSHKGKCACIDGTGIDNNISCEACKVIAQNPSNNGRSCIWADNDSGYLGGLVGKTVVTIPTEKSDSCSGTDWVHIIDCTLLALLRFFVWLTTLASTIFSWIMNPNNITSILSSNAIYSSWTLVRDALNISFIMFLLFSAFATVFQIDKYSYKKTLLMVVIMALLVNFSFPISRFIIDVSNMMMFYFSDTLHVGTEKAQEIVNFANVAGLPGILKPAAATGSGTTALLAAIVFVFIFAVTILTISILFLIRTIALAILIIFSSLAFIGAAIPPLSSYANDWWKKLFSYSFFGPIMLFTMYIASSLMTEISKSAKVDMAKIATVNTSMPEYIANLSYFSIPIVILWMGLGIAQSMSIAGAGAVVGQGRKIMNLPVKFGKWGGSTLLNKTDRGLAKSKYMWWASPTAFKTAWKENTAEKERKAFKIATGSWRDKLNKISGEKTNFKDTAIQNNIATKEKELQSTSTDFRYLYNEYKKARSAGDHEKMSATLRIIASNNDLNDFMQEEGDTMDPTNVRERVYAQLTKAGMSTEQAAKQLADIGEISFGKGNFQLFGMGKFNIKTGKYEKNKDIDIDPATGADSGQFAMAAGKATNIKAQTKTDLWHWNSFLQQNADGTTGAIHGVGIKQLNSITPSEIGQLNRARKDFFDRMSERIPEMQAHANSIRTTNPTQAGIIDEFLIRVEKFKKDPKYKP